ncbi:MAG TPA: ABC transporter ATP-binding protein [Gallionella sp.]|nr:ABC transporter ATP-binding protein [Gallionella sp.]
MLVLDNVCKSYSLGSHKVPVLTAVSLKIGAGEMCSITGPSGSGKTTLLNIMSLLDVPGEGRVLYQGQDITHAPEPLQADIRNRAFGFVFQSFNLLPRLSALDNIGLPLRYRGIGKSERRRLAYPLLERVGLADRADHLPNALSGGQRQRVAIARALIGQPEIIFADEPTGNLDTDSTSNILNLLDELNRETNVSVVVVTHDVNIGTRYAKQIVVSNGSVAVYPHHPEHDGGYHD